MSTDNPLRQFINAVDTFNRRQILLESKTHPLPGHAYHKKTDAALRYIIKDAGEAAKAMKDHSPKSEAKYLDQVNDASTILSWRRKHSTPDWYKKHYNLTEESTQPTTPTSSTSPTNKDDPFKTALNSAEKMAPANKAKLADINKKYQGLSPEQRKIMTNMQSGMQEPKNSSEINRWIDFTNKNLDLAKK